MAAWGDHEYRDQLEIDEAGQTSLGVVGEQRALDGLAAPAPMLDQAWSAAKGYGHADALLAITNRKEA